MSNPSANPEFDALLKHSRWVRALAHALIADPEAAEDVAQNTWLAVAKNPPSKIQNPRAWLGGVVRNIAGSHWRAQKARRREEAKEDIRWLEDVQASEIERPDFIADRLDTARKIVDGLSEIPEPNRETLYLRFFDELSLREIAKRMNVPQSTAHARIQRGLEMLRGKLASSIGKDWCNSCLAFTLPLTKVASGGLIMVLTMTLKTKVFVGLAALALITLFTWRPWTPPDIRDDQLGRVVVVLDTPREDAGLTTNEAATTMERFPLESEDFPNMEMASAESGAPFVIIVRDEHTLDPVANAEVFVLDHMIEFRMDVLKAEEEEQLDLEQKLERFGVMHTTDEDGEVHIPFPAGQIEIGARAGNQFAYFQQYANQKGSNGFAELLLRPALSQRVVVVDEAGHPVANVAVGLSLRNTAPILWRAVVLETNEQGIVEFRHLEVPLARSRNGECIFGLRIPCANPQFADAEQATIGKDDIRFVVPVTGEVQVICRYSNGRPLEDLSSVTLQLNNGKPITFNDETVGRQTAWIKDGVATFERVGIHTELLVRTYSRETREPVTVTGPGPSRFGDVSRLELIIPSETPHLQVRALGPDQDPLAKTEIYAMLDFFDRQGKWQKKTFDETSDEDGWVSLSIDGILKEGVQQARLLLYPGRRSETIGQVSFALLDVNLVSPTTEQESLETTLGESLIVAGKVVDTEGNPAVGQEVRLRINDPKGTGSMNGTEIGKLHLKTDKQGRFRFAGLFDRTQYFFTLYLDWRNPIPFTIGQDDLVIPQLGQDEFSCRVLLDDPDWYRELRVVVLPLKPESGETKVLGSDALEQGNGRFRIAGVHLKEIRLQLQEHGGSLALAELVPADQVVESSIEGKQLPEWDLRGKLFKHVLHIEAEGTLHPALLVLVSEYGQISGHWVPGKPFTFFAPEPIVDFEIRVDGYRPQECRSHGEASIVLVDGIPVRVVLPEDVPFPENSYWSMVFTATGSNEMRHSIRRLLAAGHTDYPAGRLPFAGSWEVTLTFLMYSSWAGGTTELRPLVEFENGSTSFAIDVKETGMEQKFTLPVTLQALKDALPPVPD